MSSKKKFLIDEINLQDAWRLFKILSEFVDWLSSTLGLAETPPGAGDWERRPELEAAARYRTKTAPVASRASLSAA